ncbi:MAG: hypothetical protein FWE72_05450 [Spirochaetaceae bacterium]|nr:hypothetical protein [Spirochaetaceae bacterium]
MLNKVLIPVFFTIIFTLFSCSSKQSIDVAENGDISCNMNIKITEMFMSYVDDLSEAMGVKKNTNAYFDVEQIEKSFASYDNVTLEKISTPTKDALNLRFTIKNDAKGISKATDGILTLSESSGNKKIKFIFDKNKYRIVSKKFLIEENPILSRLAPYPDEPFTEDEYLDTADYVFSEYSKDAVAIIKNCFVDIEINIKGKIVAAQGGKISGSKATFSIPVLKFLTLYDPISLEVEYR